LFIHHGGRLSFLIAWCWLLSGLRMNAYAKRVLILIVGWGFLLLGIAGLFLPILQGVLFLVIGLIILSSEYVWAHHLLARLRKHFPKISRIADEAAVKAGNWLRRISGQRQAH
jgi:hypothetical protein